MGSVALAEQYELQPGITHPPLIPLLLFPAPTSLSSLRLVQTGLVLQVIGIAGVYTLWYYCANETYNYTAIHTFACRNVPCMVLSSLPLSVSDALLYCQCGYIAT